MTTENWITIVLGASPILIGAVTFITRLNHKVSELGNDIKATKQMLEVHMKNATDRNEETTNLFDRELDHIRRELSEIKQNNKR